MKESRVVPFRATHPGEMLKDELKSRCISPKEFASKIGLGANVLNEIIRCKRSISPEIADMLEKALNIPADFWLKFQMQHDSDLSLIETKDITTSLYKVEDNECAIAENIDVKYKRIKRMDS